MFTGMDQRQRLGSPINRINGIACAHERTRQKFAHDIIVIGKQNPDHSLALFPALAANRQGSGKNSPIILNNSSIVSTASSD